MESNGAQASQERLFSCFVVYRFHSLVFFAGCLLFMLSFLVCVVLFLDVFIHISSAQRHGFSFLCMCCDILSNIIMCFQKIWVHFLISYYFIGFLSYKLSRESIQDGEFVRIRRKRIERKICKQKNWHFLHFDRLSYPISASATPQPLTRPHTRPASCRQRPHSCQGVDWL